MAAKKQKYSLDYKEKTVGLAEKIGITAAAKQKNVHRSQIRRWKKSLDSQSFSDEGKMNKFYFKDFFNIQFLWF